MKMIKVAILMCAALAMLSVPSVATTVSLNSTEQCCATTDDDPIEGLLTKEDCDNIGGDWRCFPGGRCGCF